MIARAFILLACSLIMTIHSVAQPTLAERLGYDADAKLVLIHSDDIGMSHSTNEACIEVFDAGIVKSGSVMVPCPWFSQIAQWAVENPEVCLGIHLTHTAEWKQYRWGPIAGRTVVPSLLDPNGFFFRGVSSVVEYAKPEEVEVEIRAQIDKALAHGIKPTHLDSHMGTLYAKPEFLQAALKVSEEYDIPFMFFNPTPMMMERTGNQFPVELSKQMAARGIPLLDGLLGIGDVPVEGMKEAYMDLFRNVEPGVFEVILHPAKDGDELRAITGSAARRHEEYKIFTDPEMKEFIESLDIHIISWKDMLPLWHERQK